MKDLEGGDSEGWYGEFYDVEVFRSADGLWEEVGEERQDWREKAERLAKRVAMTEQALTRVVLVREIRQPIAGATFAPNEAAT